jgi:hypothetical protein
LNAITLSYDQLLSRSNSWRMLDDDSGIRARIRVASAGEVIVNVAIRWRRGPERGLVYARPLDQETWMTESAELNEGLPRLELVLTRAPAHVCAALREL